MAFILETKNITIQIANKRICHRLNLTIEPGDRWALLGPNGSGKTTLLLALAGLHPVKEGQIYLQNKFLNAWSRKHIARQLAILFQESHFAFSQTVLEFCQTGRYPHDDANESIAWSNLCAMELETFAKRKVQTLSGGEKRRLLIATILTQTPQLFLLDEPLNHLDLRHQIQTLQYFVDQSTHQSIAFMMAIHDIHLAKQFCNKFLLFFENGNIRQGNASEMLTTENLSLLYQIPIESPSIAGSLF